jgi:hypothetical protein
MRLRQATGTGVSDSRLFLLNKSPELVDRIVRAHETQSERTLHDPIEDDPEFSHAIAEADREVDNLVKDEPMQLGLCHLTGTTKRGFSKSDLISIGTLQQK